MKTIHELNTDELNELRESYFIQLQETDEEVLSNIVSAEQIPMENVVEHYEGIYFVEEDFFCNI